MHIAHVLQGIAQILHREACLRAFEVDVTLTPLLQSAVDPFRAVTAGDGIGAQGDLEEREPFGVGFLTDIRRKRRDIEVFLVRMYFHTLEKVRILGDVL